MPGNFLRSVFNPVRASLLMVSIALFMTPAVTAQEKIAFEAIVLPAGENSCRVVITVQAEERWHVYRPMEGAFTIPVSATMQLPAGASIDGEWIFDTRSKTDDHMVNGDSLSATVRGAGASAVAAGGLKVRYQACNESTCLPPKTIDVKMTVAGGSGPAPAIAEIPFDNSPVFDPMNQAVNNRRYYQVALERGQKWMEQPNLPTLDQLNEQLRSRTDPSLIGLPSVPPVATGKVGEMMIKSSLVIGEIYDCGRCNNLHLSSAGGVVVGEGGLVLTNYHVVQRRTPGSKSLIAMNMEGVTFPVLEVLSASEKQDVALIRLGGRVDLLQPAPLADSNPPVTTRVNVLSHPHRQYMVMTDGQVSRYSADDRAGYDSIVWMETTAEFGGGSSGSAIFDTNGNVVGLVSMVLPLIRKQEHEEEEAGQESQKPKRPDFVEVMLRKCVPAAALRARFAER